MISIEGTKPEFFPMGNHVTSGHPGETEDSL